MLRKTRNFLRKILHRKRLAALRALAAKEPLLEQVLREQDKYEIDLLIRPYAHKFAGKKTTLARLENDILTFLPLLGRKGCAEGFCVRLCARPKVISEGLFSLQLEFLENPIYSLSISIYEGFLLLCCAQGLVDAATLKAATKAAHGLRPINLALQFATNFAAQHNLRLAGVKNSAQLSGFKRRKNEFVNYDDLWRENADELEEFEHFYALEISRKAPEQIASKKRAQYRRRYALIDEILKEFYEAR